MRARLDISYDGTDFAGWARQDGQRTVAATLEAALAVVLRLPEPAPLTVAGRTDAGVHARGQVAHLDVPAAAWVGVVGRSADAPAAALVRRLAGLLPRDVRVTGAVQAAAGFDARFAALSRRYAYRISDAPGGVDPLARSSVLAWPRPLDVAAMEAAAQGMVGEHDFAAYCKQRPNQSTVRRLARFSWRREHGLIVADVQADAFCHHMVRALVGACLAVGEGRRDPAWPARVLAGRVKDSAVSVVPAHGLTLEQVCYPPVGELAARVQETRRRRPALEDRSPGG